MTVKEKILDALNKFLAKIKNIFVAYNDVVDNCASTSTDLPLSANQGKVIQEKISELNMNLLVNGSFTNIWAIGSMVTGYGFIIVIPKNYKSRTLQVSSVEIYNGSWNSATVRLIAGSVNSWNIVCDLPSGVSITNGSTYLARITGTIS